MINEKKKDCFAYMHDKQGNSMCFGLKECKCAGCKFYKHADDPEAERKKISVETALYATLWSGVR